MAVSLNSVIGFAPTAKYQQVKKTNVRILLLKVPSINSPSGPVRLRQCTEGKRSRFHLSATGGDNVAIGTTDKVSETTEGSYSDDGSPAKISDINSSATEDEVKPIAEVGSEPEVSEVLNGSANSKPTLKRSPLTARERLRAARVLNRYTEAKPSKPQLGSKLLEALQESDKGKKRPGLPEAPTNLFDDSKRGLPKQGWTIDIVPGGMDIFLVIFSFVFISSVMFATTYIVWKVGAIHFNEY
ncbi:uncharacterized protein LOC105167031 [Sesamum indicum]|uniref:Uncharacterized protein LOC105167031 n=1 Tax=Sesamum indicum TaxID=4182 RepID=A0A6I9TIB4_SESIN|nr:uncharacterized protein LOC105167031 [Sesamum indicum]